MKIKNIYILIIIVIMSVFNSCTNVKTETWENGNDMSEVTMKGDKKNGKATWWYKTGVKQMETVYKNDEIDGLLKRWHPNSMIESISNYSDGKLNGKKEVWDKNGVKLIEENYKNDTLDGAFKSWYDNKVQKIEGFYAKGKYTGKWKSWDVKGFLVGEGDFNNGDGIQKNYNIKGNLILTVEFKNNQKDGKETWYNEKGEAMYIKYYEKGNMIRSEDLTPKGKVKK